MEIEGGKGRFLKPLNIKCTSSDCDQNLHCFRKTRKMAEIDKGKCRACGIQLIDWKRIHKRDITDIQYTFQSLKLELFRHHYWHKQLDEKVINHAKRKGLHGLRVAATNRLKKSVCIVNNPYDGRQTPLEGNIIYYAQHATACCCRACMEYWYNIPKDFEIDTKLVNYFVDLIMMYIVDRLPNLPAEPQFIPRIYRIKK